MDRGVNHKDSLDLFMDIYAIAKQIAASLKACTNICINYFCQEKKQN